MNIKLALEECKEANQDDKVSFPSFVTISSEAAFNPNTKVYTIDNKKPIKLNQSSGSIFIKYPLDKQFVLTLGYYSKEECYAELLNKVQGCFDCLVPNGYANSSFPMHVFSSKSDMFLHLNKSGELITSPKSLNLG